MLVDEHEENWKLQQVGFAYQTIIIRISIYDLESCRNILSFTSMAYNNAYVHSQ